MNIIEHFLLNCSRELIWETDIVDKVKDLINKAKENEINLPYNKGISQACFKKNDGVIKLLITDPLIYEQINIDNQIKSFEVALNKNNIELVEFFLFNDKRPFSIYPAYYLKKNTLIFNPLSPKLRFGKEIESLLLTLQLTNELNLQKTIGVVKKKMKL